jgi:exonuclease III
MSDVEESRSFRVATWNMDHWRRSPDEHDAGWLRLTDHVNPSVALLQEHVPPSGVGPTRSIYREIGRHRHWGSAIVALEPDIELTEIVSAITPYSSQSFTLANTFPGSVAFGRVVVPGVDPITLVSVYAVIDVYSQTTLLRIVADLIPLFDSVDGGRVILGGDFNLGTDTARPELPRYEAVIRAVKSLGLVDLYECVQDRPPRPDACGCGLEDCRHLTTREGGGQFDHLYASPALAEQCRRIVRYDDPETRTLSDHWPIVAEFALTTGRTKRRWDLETFTSEVSARHGSPAGRVVERLADLAQRKQRALDRACHQGVRLDRFSIPDSVDPVWDQRLELYDPRVTQPLWSVSAQGQLTIPLTDATATSVDQAMRDKLVTRLMTIPSASSDAGQGKAFVAIPLAALSDASAWETVITAIEWIVNRSLEVRLDA